MHSENDKKLPKLTHSLTSLKLIEKILNEIEEKIRRNSKEEIESKTIGEYVMEKLKETDHVAYIRFASVYRSFTDVSSFEEEIKNLTQQKKAKEGEI